MDEHPVLPTGGPQDEGGPLVRPDWACPVCGERRMDRLVVLDEDKEITERHSDVRCATCGAEYVLEL